MSMTSDRLCFTLDREIGGAGALPPEEVQLLPAGIVEPRGKSSFIVDELSVKEILDAFGASGTDLVVDYEHQSLSGSEAPAAGWVRSIEDRKEDGLWAKVDWTERAAEYLANREYRYISPVVLIRKSDGRAVELLGAALTNLPAIEGMEPVINSAVCAECGPGDGCCRTREDYSGVMRMLGLSVDARPEDAACAIEALRRPDGLVPESELESLRRELKAKEAEALIAGALSDGRLTPPMARWARSYAEADIEGFRQYLKTACPVVPLSGTRAERGLQPDAAQSGVNALLGISDEAFARYARHGL